MTLKLNQIRKIIDEYLPIFPKWKVYGKDVIYRCKGPAAQALRFDRSSGDDYRPQPFFWILMESSQDPFSYDFLQPLMRKNRVSSSRPSVRWGSVGVTLRDHEHEKPHLLRDMQEQLCPRIGEPLEFESAYKACKKSVFSERGPTSPQLVTLAAMEAYKGDEKTARDTIRKARANINSIPTDRFAKCDQERLDYLDALERWLDEGTARQHLDEIVAAEKRRYGIEDTE